jgi:hypothetical protein
MTNVPDWEFMRPYSEARSICGALGIIAVRFKGKQGLETYWKWSGEHGGFKSSLFFNDEEGTFIVFRGLMPDSNSREIGPGVEVLHGNAIKLSLFLDLDKWDDADNFEQGIQVIPDWLQSLVYSGTISPEVTA